MDHPHWSQLLVLTLNWLHGFQGNKVPPDRKKPRFKNRGSKTAKLQKWRTESLVSWLEPEWVCWRLLARSQVKSAKLPLSDLEYVLFC